MEEVTDTLDTGPAFVEVLWWTELTASHHGILD